MFRLELLIYSDNFKRQRVSFAEELCEIWKCFAVVSYCLHMTYWVSCKVACHLSIISLIPTLLYRAYSMPSGLIIPRATTVDMVIIVVIKWPLVQCMQHSQCPTIVIIINNCYWPSYMITVDQDICVCTKDLCKAYCQYLPKPVELLDAIDICASVHS